MGDNGEVLPWDGIELIGPGVPACQTLDDIPAVSAAISLSPTDYRIGYEQALNDVLIEIVRVGKGHLVQWIEGRLKDLP